MSDAQGSVPDLSVIIVTKNVKELALDSIRAVLETADGLDLEVIVVDNASSDGVVDAVRARFPHVTVLESGGNMGFPIPNNMALRQSRGRHVLFLNPDTVVGPGALRASVAALDADDSIGIVGCRLVYGDGRPQYEGGRNTYRLWHLALELVGLHAVFPHNRVFGHHLIGHWDHLGTRDVEAVSGAYLMVRREAADRVGGLPEDVFIYHEDLSFCLRVRRAGWRIRYLGDPHVVHYANQSTNKLSSPEWDLLEVEYKWRLIAEADGRIAAGMARVLFGIRALIRLGAASLPPAMPGVRQLRQRRPRAFHRETHRLHLRWALSPASVRDLVPRAPYEPRLASAARTPAVASAGARGTHDA